jgi:hypothetical protein
VKEIVFGMPSPFRPRKLYFVNLCVGFVGHTGVVSAAVRFLKAISLLVQTPVALCINWNTPSGSPAGLAWNHPTTVTSSREHLIHGFPFTLLFGE